MLSTIFLNPIQSRPIALPACGSLDSLLELSEKLPLQLAKMPVLRGTNYKVELR
jgi:hypothetical protein